MMSNMCLIRQLTRIVVVALAAALATAQKVLRHRNLTMKRLPLEISTKSPDHRPLNVVENVLAIQANGKKMLPKC